MRGLQRKDKKKRKRELLEPDQLEEQLRLRYGYLAIREMEFERRLRNKAIRLSRKHKKQADSWVI